MATFMKNNKRYIEHTVLAGETAYGIAQAKLYNGNRWGELVKMNESDGHPPISQYPHVYTNQQIGYPDDSYVPSTTDMPQFNSWLKVIASAGVNIRDQPNANANIVVHDVATKGVNYKYQKNSETSDDAHMRTYVYVHLDPPVNGHDTGWLPVSGPSNLADVHSPTEIWVQYE